MSKLLESIADIGEDVFYNPVLSGVVGAFLIAGLFVFFLAILSPLLAGVRI